MQIWAVPSRSSRSSTVLAVSSFLPLPFAAFHSTDCLFSAFYSLTNAVATAVPVILGGGRKRLMNTSDILLWASADGMGKTWEVRHDLQLHGIAYGPMMMRMDDSECLCDPCCTLGTA